MIGERVGNFEIVSRLGKGGMGEVWLAEQKSIRTRVAIKMLSVEASGDAHQKQRLFNEAIAVSKIPHAGIVKIFDVGEHAGRAYLAMEFLEGETLTARIQRSGKLTVREVADFGRQIASVLDAAHAAGITHRDLKPDNIYLVHDAELGGARVKVLDFGIAKLQNAAMTAMSVSSMGTPNYMSPEQWHSLAQVDWRTDAYSLGCVVFEMLCGRPPFVAQSLGEAAQLHMLEPPPAPSSIVPGLPPQLDELVLRLLDKELPPRPTMKDTMAAFGALASGQPFKLPGSPSATMTKARLSVVNASPDAAGVFLSASATAMASSGAPGPAVQRSVLEPPPDAGTASLRMAAHRDAPPRKSRAWLFVVIAIVLVAGVAAAAFTLNGSETPAPVAEATPTPAPGRQPSPVATQPSPSVPTPPSARPTPPAPSPPPPSPPPPSPTPPSLTPPSPTPPPTQASPEPSAPSSPPSPAATKTPPAPPTPATSSTPTAVDTPAAPRPPRAPPSHASGASGKTPTSPQADPGKPIGLSEQEIQAAVNRNRKSIAACSRLDVSGIVEVTVRVAPDSRVAIDTSSGVAEVDTCLVTAIARVRFPATQRGGSTRMSFDLTPPRQSPQPPAQPPSQPPLPY